MKNYVQQKEDWMDVSFYADRFIEDEIDRESRTNISVVTLSYVTMFVYVALVLGEYHKLSTFLVGIDYSMIRQVRVYLKVRE